MARTAAAAIALVLITGVGAACGGGSSEHASEPTTQVVAPPPVPEAKPAATCADASKHIADSFAKSIELTNDATRDGLTTELGLQAIALCQDDHWSADAVGCYAIAGTSDGVRYCGDQLTEQQQRHFADVVGKMMGKYMSADHAGSP